MANASDYFQRYKNKSYTSNIFLEDLVLDILLEIATI